MTSSALNLSLLARGVGEVKKNGHERVDVVLEPEDYFNFVTNPHRVYLPPLQPKYAFSDGSAEHESPRAPIPKTFITRKGALLLFSEDFAVKSSGTSDGNGPFKKSADDLALKTFGDLAKSILSYGSHGDGDKVHLRFVHDQLGMPRKIRPGFSARRYLSRLTRSFDDSFLDALTSQGFIQEKTLYQTNTLAPNIRRRINDDLSYLPAPYRIMKSMLVAPGFLSGYNFQRLGTQDSEELLSTVMEEEEVDSESRRQAALQLVERQGDGTTQAVSYSDLDQIEKENVLADLLVKSAINHALEKQKQRLLDDSGSTISASLPDQSPDDALPSAHGSDAGREHLEFDMAEAVRSYLESQMDSQSVVSDAQTIETGVKRSRANSLKDSKASQLSSKSLEGSSHGSLRDLPGGNSGTGGASFVSLKGSSSAGSHRSTSDARMPSSTGNVTMPSGGVPLSPIKDVDSREPTFNKTPVLPPIQTPGAEEDDTNPHIPKVKIQPPTPQMTSLSLTTKHGLSREPTVHTVPEAEDEKANIEDEEEEEDSKAWGAEIDEAALLQQSAMEEENEKKEALLKQKQNDLLKRSSQQSLLSLDSSTRKGPVLAGGSYLQSSQESLASDNLQASQTSIQSHPAFGMKGSPLRASGSVKSQPHIGSANSSQSRKEQVDIVNTSKGSVLIGPHGEKIFVGGAVGAQDPELASNQSDEQSVFSEGIDSKRETWPSTMAKGQHSGRASPHGYGKSRGIDPSSGDFDATLSMNVKRITSQSDENEDTPRSSMSGGERRMSVRGSVTEQELVQTLTEHAHKIASQVLNQPATGEDLGIDAKVAAELWISSAPANQLSRSQSLQPFSAEAEAAMLLRERSQSADPSVAEYRRLLKDTISNAVVTSGGDAIPDDAQVSDELVVALSQQRLSPADIEVVKDEGGNNLIRPRSTVAATGDGTDGQDDEGTSDKATEGATGGGPQPSHLAFDVINYGEADKPEEDKSELAVRLPGASEVLPGDEDGKSVFSEKSSPVKSQVSVVDNDQADRDDPVKSAKRGNSIDAKQNKSATKSKSSLEDRDEFVVGKVEDKKELERLYGQPDKPPPTKETKEKKAAVPVVKKTKKVKGKKGKKGKKEQTVVEEETKEKQVVPSPAKLLTPVPVQGADGKSSSRSSSAKSESQKSKEESEMSFIIIRDVESSPEPEVKSEAKSVRLKPPSSAGTSRHDSEDESNVDDMDFSDLDYSEDEDTTSMNTISNKDARAAKRAAQAAKRREQVERKRREREEQMKREREDAERRDRMERELEEERRRKDEDKRLKKLQAEEEQKRREEEEAERQRRAKLDADREKKQRDEYAKKLEEMRKKQAEEDRLRREREEEERIEAEARRKAEEELLATMAEEERQEYLRRKAEEEEQQRLLEEQERMRREEEARKAMEEAQRLAEEMARKKAEFERRLAFNRGLQLESSGLQHTQDITRAFVFSYFELLQWLGLEVPDLEKLKGGHY